MKKALISTCIYLSVLLTACGGGQGGTLLSSVSIDSGSRIIVTGTADAEIETATAEETNTDVPALEMVSESERTGENSVMENIDTMLQITVSIGGTVYQARLYDNDAARELVERMPFELDMKELNGNEKFNYLPESLPTDVENTGSIHTGDLMLYGSDCLVLFYKDFQTSFHYTRIGYLEEPVDLSDVLGSGNARVSFNLVE